MPNPVETIKERLNIAEVAAGYISLEKAGSNFKARCPFHQEKTPSFFVSPGRNSYYCFGCGAKGDIFTFVQEMEGLDFREALKMLADKAGVTIDSTKLSRTPAEKEKEARLYEALDAAASFFESNLAGTGGKASRDYLKERGLNEDTISSFRIGFAPDEWSLLKSHLHSLGFTDEELFATGLIKLKEGGREPYDVFRGRIIFPIFDATGRVIAFSGRLLGQSDTSPKYLNSPDTVLFNKSEVLYGLHKAKAAIRGNDYAILVEGQFDLALSHQAGIPQTIATSGTAVSEGHLARLKRLSGRLIIALDGDDAGIAAALRTGEMALKAGFEVKCAPLEKGKDPADTILESAEKYKDIVRGGKHIVEFVLDLCMSNNPDRKNLAREVGEKVLPLIALIPDALVRSHFVLLVAEKTGLKEDAVWDEVKRKAGGKTYPPRIASAEASPKINQLEKHLAGIVLWQREEKEPVLGADELEKMLLSFLKPDELSSIIERYESQKEELIFEVENYYRAADSVAHIKELILGFEDDRIRESMIRITADLAESEKENDQERAKELLISLKRYSDRKMEIEKARAGLFEN